MDGDQLYVEPPLAVNVVDEPLHIGVTVLTVMDGNAFTDTVTDAVLLQPLASVPVTV